jgi:hypothetical protein
MNAKDRLNQARQWAVEGRHEEALKEYVWFHQHALEESGALRGVRLSFALSWWVDLAEVYLPARAAFDAARQAKIDRLLAGVEDRQLFKDVRAMNWASRDESSTYRLFVRLRGAWPELAAECADIALPDIVEARDFALARECMPDPEPAIEWKAGVLNDDVRNALDQPEPHRRTLLDGFARAYADDVRLLSEVLRHTGDSGAAAALEARALEFVADDGVRAAVSVCFEA